MRTKDVMGVCSCCGKPFSRDISYRFKYCSERCAKEMKRGHGKSNMIQKKENAMSIQEIAKKAREAGMTYGKYVAMMEAKNGNDSK